MVARFVFATWDERTSGNWKKLDYESGKATNLIENEN
jgi:hypothetical protein